MTPDAMDDLVALSVRLVKSAGLVIRRHFRRLETVEEKPDLSPVTVADRGAEQAIREGLAAERPEDGIHGEEYGVTRPDAPYMWVIDPIDGTKAFVHGRPTWGTLLALLHEGEPVLGIINQPVLGDRWIGAAGRPTTFNGQPVRTRPCSSLAHAVMSTTSPDTFRSGDRAQFERVAQKSKLCLYGGDCYAFGLLAAGFQDLVIDGTLKLYDYAALVPVLTGAGGVITDWEGRALVGARETNVIAAGDATVHSETLALIAPSGTASN